jgi:hypothetical protein
MSDLDKAFSQYLIDKETPPPPPASETTDENDMSFGDYLDQVLTTIGDIPDMAIRGALRGLGETAFTLGIIDEPQIEKYRKAMDASSKLAVTEGSNRIVSSLGEGVSLIGVTALPAFRALRAMGMGRTTSGIIAEAVGGAVSVNPDDPNLGNLAQALMGEDRSGPFADAMDILATNPEDPAIMNRARNAIQDSTIGLAFEGLIRSPGAARAMVDRWKSGRSAIPFGEMRENIAEAGARADERLKSTMSGSTLSANPVGAMGDMAVSAAGRLARTDDETAPVFFSAVSNAVDALPMEKGGGDQMRAMIAKGQGVKAEEMSWIGLDDFLKGKKSVTKQEVRDYVEANQVRIEEVVRADEGVTQEIGYLRRRYEMMVEGSGDYAELPPSLREERAEKMLAEIEAMEASNVVGRPKFGDYTLPGGENYREVLLRLPVKTGAETNTARYEELNNIAARRNLTDSESDEMLAIERAEFSGDSGAAGEDFVGGHFDEKNVLAHLRLTDRTGPDGEKILFIEEIQSDWHQKGRKQGYKIPLEKLNEQTRNDYLRMVELENSGPRTTAEERIEYSSLKEKYGGDSEKIIGKIPDAPLKKNWHEMTLRRVARMAAEEGYDRIAWTPGKMQAERYDLSKQVGLASLAKEPDGKYTLYLEDVKGQRIRRLGDGQNWDNEYGQQSVTPDELVNLVGKDLADKLLSGADEIANAPSASKNSRFFDLRGTDLQVGGEGMKGFYDKMLKNYASKWGKKFDSKVGVTNLDNEGYGAEVDGELTEYFATRKQAQDYIDSLPNVDESRIVESGTGEVWTMPVTKKMKDSVLRKGVPFFGVAGATAMVGQQENNNDN